MDALNGHGRQSVRGLLNRGWRLVFTGLSFALFGVGGLLLGLIVFSLFHILFPRSKAERLCRYGVHLAFRGFIGFMHRTGVLDYHLHNARELRKSGQLIIANHPSLIDIVFIVAQIPDAYCVVKAAAWKNPFMALTMRATGYIQNTSPISFIDKCVEILQREDTLIMFPEGTRTKPGKPLRFMKGTARIALKAEKPLIPVYLYLDPTTLTKGEPWYLIPLEKVQVYLCVGSAIEPHYVTERGAAHRKNVSAVTRYLVNYFEAKRKNAFIHHKANKGS